MTRIPANPAIAPQNVLQISQLNAVRLLTILAIGIGYASTMGTGETLHEWGYHWGYDPSWFGIQVLFFLSGWMAMRSLAAGKTAIAYLLSRARRIYPLLIFVTSIVVLVIYPLFCAPEARTIAAIPRLARYFFETASLIRPSQALPGIMDDAKYMCLVQGAIWTLRWGAVFHICVALAWRFNLLQQRYVLPALTAVGLLAYIVAVQYTISTGSDQLRALIPALKLGYAFGAGMTAFQYQHLFPKSGKVQLAILAGLGIAATGFTILLPQSSPNWIPASDILGSAFWAYFAFIVLHRPMALLRNWPNLVLPTFLTLWPSAQVLLLISPNIPTTALIISALCFSLSFACAVAYFQAWRSGLAGKATI